MSKLGSPRKETETILGLSPLALRGKDLSMSVLKATKSYVAPVPKQRTTTLTEMVEQAAEDPKLNKFEDSKTDRHTILKMQTAPKIRQNLHSLVVKDRFQTETTPKKVKKITINKTRYRSKINEAFGETEDRPLSI